MADKRSIKHNKAERTAYRRAAEVVDAHTLTVHFMTNDALAAGQHPGGRYIALCGEDVLPASLGEPGRERCGSCVARRTVTVPAQRS